MSGQLHFAVDARRIERGIGRGRVSSRQRFGVRGLDELQERAGQTRLLEDPEVTLRPGIMLVLPLHALEEFLSLSGRHERSMYAERSRHRRSDHSGFGKVL